jgi:hypothetical protein
MLQYDEFALVLISEIFSQYGSWLEEALCVYCSKLSFIVQLLLINYSSDILAFMDKTSLCANPRFIKSLKLQIVRMQIMVRTLQDDS